MQNHGKIFINDSREGLIALTDYEKKIISSIAFNRLHDVYQNSTAYLTFPSNRTKRFEHSIGTMKLCSDIFFYSVANSESDTLKEFFKLYENEYKKMLNEIKQELADGKWQQNISDSDLNDIPDINCESFSTLIPSNITRKKDKKIQFILIQSVRAAALLHDIGHPPFSHIVEYAMRDIYHEYKKINCKPTPRASRYLQTMEPFFIGENELHEEMGVKISDSILNSIYSDDSECSSAESLKNIMIQKTVHRMFKDEEGLFCDLHKIIASSIDGDRLDYITRDSINSGINTGSIDYKRIIFDMRILINKTNESLKVLFCPPVKAVNSIEDVLLRRFNLYKTVIYHHRVIKTDNLLKNIVMTLIKTYLDSRKAADNNNDETDIPEFISGLWFPLQFASNKSISVSLSQWNDAWLMTFLRKVFYKDYYKLKEKSKVDSRYILKEQLTELLLNTKKYHTLIKRSEDFRIIDDKVKLEICNNSKKIRSKLKKFENESSDISSKQNVAAIDFAGASDFIKNLIEFSERHSGFVITQFLEKAIAIDVNKEDFIRKIKEDSRISIENILGKESLDVMFIDKQINLGTKETIFMVDSNGEPKRLNNISGIEETLKGFGLFLPRFYIYVLTKEKETLIRNKKKILEEIGTHIGKLIVDKIEKILNEAKKI